MFLDLLRKWCRLGVDFVQSFCYIVGVEILGGSFGKPPTAPLSKFERNDIDMSRTYGNKVIAVTPDTDKQFDEVVDYLGLNGDMDLIFGAIMATALSEYHYKLMKQKRAEDELWAFMSEYRSITEQEEK